MQGDAAAAEQPVAHVLEAGRDEEPGEIPGPGKAANARGKVGVGLPAREHLAGERHEHVEPEPEERAQDSRADA